MRGRASGLLFLAYQSGNNGFYYALINGRARLSQRSPSILEEPVWPGRARLSVEKILRRRQHEK